MSRSPVREHPSRAARRASPHAAALALLLAASPRAWGQSLPELPVPAAGRTTAAAPATPDGAGAPIEGRVDPDTYRVGPGDEFAFRHSDLLDAQILRVNPSGDLLLPDVGPLSLAGLTLREADAKIRSSIRSYVRGKGLVFSLHRPRRFRMPVLGEVNRPGAVTLQAPVRASEAIETAGGIGPAGARRGIEIRRGIDTLRVDLIRYERAGSLEANPLVFETDVLYVPPAGRWIEIHGAVPHGGRLDFRPGDRLSGLVALAGGPMPQAALEEASLSRVDAAGRDTAVAIRLPEALARPGSEEDLTLDDGDRLFIPARAHWKEGAVVEVSGEVARPGSYPIRDGVDRLGSVIARAGGLTEFADGSRARVERVVSPALPDTTFLALARAQENLLTRDERDYVKLHARARGALSADVGSLFTARDARADVVLRDGDRIVVPRNVGTVSVQGEVRRPGHVAHESGWRVGDYVREAGGFTGRADRGRLRVTLGATGRQVPAQEVRELRAGDILWIPARPDRSTWGSIKDALATAAQAATIYLVIREATR